MATGPKRLGRNNDIYAIRDCVAVNNVGSDLKVGDVVIIDWTAEGTDVSLIAPTTAALMTTHMKAVVLPQPNQAGIPSTLRGQVRVMGPCDVGVSPGQAFTLGDPISLTVPGNSTAPSLLTATAVSAPGTTSTYIPQTVGASLITTASSAAAQTMRVIFDGTNINAVYLKD